MNIVLTPRHERFISRKVKSGAYGSAEEVVGDGLRRLEADDERQQRLAWLRAEVEKGFAGSATPWTKKDSERVRQLIARRAQARP
jgi:putative addiction module CopG family antidote